MTLIITTAGAQAQGCTPNHELSRIVPEYRAIMLDGGEIKRVMFVDPKDERLTLWKPNWTCRFPASSSRTKLHAFTHGTRP
jgi:hypothetical protein